MVGGEEPVADYSEAEGRFCIGGSSAVSCRAGVGRSDPIPSVRQLLRRATNYRAEYN